MERDFDHLIIRPIAHIRTDFSGKFGIPRQASVVKGLHGRIVFGKEFRKDGIIRGMEGFSHLILIWGFSQEKEDRWSSMIRPPKLGGNEKVGVFASRSPNRPNPLGFSVVEIEKILVTKDGPEILVKGADMVDNTPIYDIKPYLSYSDSYPDARTGYAVAPEKIHLDVIIPEELETGIDIADIKPLKELLSQDPRPGYRKEGTFFFEFRHYHIGFQVEDNTLKVICLEDLKTKKN